MLFHIILFLCRPGSISGNTGMKINSLYFAADVIVGFTSVEVLTGNGFETQEL